MLSTQTRWCKSKSTRCTIRFAAIPGFRICCGALASHSKNCLGFVLVPPNPIFVILPAEEWGTLQT